MNGVVYNLSQSWVNENEGEERDESQWANKVCEETVNDFVQFHLWWLNDRWRGTQTGQRDKALKPFSKVSMCMTEVVCLLEINIPTCQWECP